jgi:hypothetical protein
MEAAGNENGRAENNNVRQDAHLPHRRPNPLGEVQSGREEAEVIRGIIFDLKLNSPSPEATK